MLLRVWEMSFLLSQTCILASYGWKYAALFDHIDGLFHTSMLRLFFSFSSCCSKARRNQKEGAQGQKKSIIIHIILTVPLAFVQSYGMIILLNSLVREHLSLIHQTGVSSSQWWPLSRFSVRYSSCGSSEQINESGLGNGISLFLLWCPADVPSRIVSLLRRDMDRINRRFYYSIITILFSSSCDTVLVIYVIIDLQNDTVECLVYTRTGRDERSYFSYSCQSVRHGPYHLWCHSLLSHILLG